ncbi:MAG TPA: hypothetical protein VGG64_29410 [Pirellulales bacterium]|jgi:hypothetical protein
MPNDPAEMADWIGSLGVAILLGAFFLNLIGRVPAGSRRYQVANALGAGLACLASYMIGFFPFVVLEGTWCAVSLASLLRGVRPQ